MKIAVIDGQGGGIGKLLVEKIRCELPEDIEIIALGTNALAASLMMRAGANKGASGENAIRCNAGKVDIIVGAIGIILADSMMGEVTQVMAQAVVESPAKKILIPFNNLGVEIVGVKNEPLPHRIDSTIQLLKESFKKSNNIERAGR